MQGTQVHSLVWEYPTCPGANSPMSHNYGCLSAYSPHSIIREASTHLSWGKPVGSKDPGHSKVKEWIKSKIVYIGKNGERTAEPPRDTGYDCCLIHHWSWHLPLLSRCQPLPCLMAPVLSVSASPCFLSLLWSFVLPSTDWPSSFSFLSPSPPTQSRSQFKMELECIFYLFRLCNIEKKKILRNFMYNNLLFSSQITVTVTFKFL